MNCAELDLEFCLFFCSQVMEALNWADCGSMSFVPILKTTMSLSSSSTASTQAQGFQARVRYRAQGLKPEQRYRHKVTRTQSRSHLLLHPFLAAQGILPAVSTRRRQQ